MRENILVKTGPQVRQGAATRRLREVSSAQRVCKARSSKDSHKKAYTLDVVASTQRRRALAARATVVEQSGATAGADYSPTPRPSGVCVHDPSQRGRRKAIRELKTLSSPMQCSPHWAPQAAAPRAVPALTNYLTARGQGRPRTIRCRASSNERAPQTSERWHILVVLACSAGKQRIRAAAHCDVVERYAIQDCQGHGGQRIDLLGGRSGSANVWRDRDMPSGHATRRL